MKDTITLLPDDFSNATVWVCAPHPDDFDAIAVTLRLFCERHALLFLSVITSGISGVEDGFVSPPTLLNKMLCREMEQLDSCAKFGLNKNLVNFLRLDVDGKTGYVLDNQENYRKIQCEYGKILPDWIFLPHGNDSNYDHQWVSNAVRMVTTNQVKPINIWRNRDPKTIALRQDAVTFFDETLAAWKAELLRCHSSQHQRNINTRGYGFDQRILRENKKWAVEFGHSGQYAETFETERI